MYKIQSILLLFVVFLVSSLPVYGGNDVAVIIGVSEYEYYETTAGDQDLPLVYNDARFMAEVFTQTGAFEVIHVYKRCKVSDE